MTSRQPRVCPQRFQDRLTEAGGLNRYGQPHFKLVWGQGGQQECFFRAGGAWEASGLGDEFPSYTGYRDLLLGFGEPSWFILQWKPPESYGSPESYYVSNYDEATGLQTLGEYPYRGRYAVLFNLSTTEKVGDELKKWRMEPNSLLIDAIIPLIRAARALTLEQVIEAKKALREQQESAVQGEIESIVRDAHPVYHGGSISFSRQGVRTPLIAKKMELLAQNYRSALEFLKRSGRGLSQRSF